MFSQFFYVISYFKKSCILFVEVFNLAEAQLYRSLSSRNYVCIFFFVCIFKKLKRLHIMKTYFTNNRNAACSALLEFKGF